MYDHNVVFLLQNCPSIPIDMILKDLSLILQVLTNQITQITTLQTKSSLNTSLYKNYKVFDQQPPMHLWQRKVTIWGDL
jgi:hypothetical protein